VITGTGIDIVDLATFRKGLSEDLVNELFRPDEINYCRTQARSWENFAARFAAKEAVFKALGAGLAQGLRWQDVAVVRSASGAVHLQLHGKAAALAKDQGVTAEHLSLSHNSQSAIAMVVLENRQPEEES